MAEILKMRVGMLHQENKVLVKSDRSREDSSGILIKLSKLSLNSKNPGY